MVPRGRLCVMVDRIESVPVFIRIARDDFLWIIEGKVGSDN